MNPSLATWAALVSCCFALAACGTLRAVRPNPAEQAILSTYAVASEEAMGSGFLVAVRSGREEETPVLVTSSHLVHSAENGLLFVYLRYVTPDGTAFVMEVPLSAAHPGRTHAIHPLFDVAAFRIEPPQGMPPDAVLLSVDEKLIDVRQEIRAGQAVTISGFPEGNAGPSGVFAVLRSGWVASFDQTFLEMPFYLVNSAIYPGDSGAPVFVTPERGQPRLVGMVVEHFVDSEERTMPLGVAVDARSIRETISALLTDERLP